MERRLAERALAGAAQSTSRWRVGGLGAAGDGLMDCLHARMAAQQRRQSSASFMDRVRSFHDASYITAGVARADR